MTISSTLPPILPSQFEMTSPKGLSKRHEQIKDVGTKFEAMMMTQMLSHMFDTVPTDGPFSGGSGEKIFRSLLIEEFGVKIAERGTLGIAQAVRESVKEMEGLQDES